MRKNKNFKKLMILAIAAIMTLSAVTIVANAAHIEIGTGTSTQTRMPYYGYYAYGYAAVIYLQSDIGMALDISGVSFDVASYTGSYPFHKDNQKVFLTHTTDSTF
jgi:uncharacterized SAM-dependent methyltransferase